MAPRLAVIAGGLLLAVPFLVFTQPHVAAWALVPWLLALPRLTPRQAFGWSYAAGLAHFLGSLWWLLHLVAFGGPGASLGWLALSAFLALYFAVFGWFVRRLCEGRALWRLLAIPAAWTALEFARSHVLSGFGWNLLGFSQVPHGLGEVVQIADLTGAWGVSFLLVLANVAIADAITAWRTVPAKWKCAVPPAIAALVWAGAHAYGASRVAPTRAQAQARVTVLQGNIAQDEKWDEAFTHEILERYGALTREAAAGDPNLIIWPETSTPGYFDLDEDVTGPVLAMAKQAGRPLLVGAPMGRLVDFQWQVTNSAALVSPEGTIAGRYDKVRLVPFGEFVPFERTLPWLRKILPAIGSFVPGAEHTVFRPEMLATPAPPPVPPAEQGLKDFLAGKPAPPKRPAPPPPFGVLICFEDIFPDVARAFVRAGAQWLVVITNDAWFGPTAAAYQHAQASTLRAIELRVPVARAANSGWSGCIDAAGRWQERVQVDGRELFVAGTATCGIAPGPGGSLYGRAGDWFAWLCTALALVTLICRGRRPKLL